MAIDVHKQIPHILHHYPLRAFNALVEFCYPSRCAVCDRDCQANQPLCDNCESELVHLESAPACSGCGAPLPDEANCPRCDGAGLKPLAKVLRLGVFDGPLKTLIHQMKYHGQWALAERLAERLMESAAVRTLLAESDLLVPVPLHWWRQTRRGYNQALVLARRLGRLADRPVALPIRRVRNTETQTHLSATARQANLRGAFALVRPYQVAGRRIVLIDDVMTTGATLRAVGRLLRRAKPAGLSALVIAAADPKGRDFETV